MSPRSKQGLRDGTIDVIATDHAPHAPDEKSGEFDYAPFGIVGLETALGLTFKLVQEERAYACRSDPETQPQSGVDYQTR